jgi:TetR/AcrR family fatty acid metabolism transcriptional regulator
MSVLGTGRHGSRGISGLSPRAGARREEILEVALDVISRKGFHDTSIADIARGARASRATVYQYFHDKRDILLALADRVASSIIGAVDRWEPLPHVAAAADGTSDPRLLVERLRAMIDSRIAQVLAAISADAGAARLLLRIVRGRDEQLNDIMRRIDTHVVGVLASDIEAAATQGWARPCDPSMTARFVLGGIEKLVIDALDPDQPVALDLASVGREIGAFVFFGLAQRHLLGDGSNETSE